MQASTLLELFDIRLGDILQDDALKVAPAIANFMNLEPKKRQAIRMHVRAELSVGRVQRDLACEGEHGNGTEKGARSRFVNAASAVSNPEDAASGLGC